MNRDELLDKLAMELEKWPSKWTDECRKAIPEVAQWDLLGEKTFLAGSDGKRIEKVEWLQRRAELINKPAWSEAPEWAEWLSQNDNGFWCWHELKPIPDHDGWIMYNPNDEKQVVSSEGATPNGHDWRQTLEPRPDFNESRADAIGQNGPTGDHYMTPEEEEIPAQEKHDCPRCGGCYYSPPHEECPCQPSATTADGILAAARQHMLDRASTYDKPEGERSMNSTVLAFAAVTGVLMTEEQGWLFMQLLKAVRSHQGDYRADSYEDGAAYVALAGEAAARDRRRP